MNDGSELVHSGSMGNRLSGVLGSPGKSKGLGSVERNRGSDLSGGSRLSTLEGSLLGGLGLNISRGGGTCGEDDERSVSTGDEGVVK